MSAPTLVKTCPEWCIATHSEDTTFHMQLDEVVADAYGRDVAISAYFNERTGKAGIYIGEHEFSADQLDELEAAIARAKQALSGCR